MAYLHFMYSYLKMHYILIHDTRFSQLEDTANSKCMILWFLWRIEVGQLVEILTDTCSKVSVHILIPNSLGMMLRAQEALEVYWPKVPSHNCVQTFE